jgi:hypothetical protein
MSWYKMAQFNDWERTSRILEKILKRKPTTDEIQNFIIERDFDDRNKKKRKNLVTAKKWKEHIPGGRASDMTPDEFEKSQIEKGKEVEFEHTPDPDIAKEIAMDHLEEHKDYYVGLKHMEEELTEIENRAKGKKNK